MRWCPDHPVRTDLTDDVGERIDRRHMAVEHRKRLAVVPADADLHHDVAIIGSVDDAADLESTHLARDDAVLDHNVGPGLGDEPAEREMLGSRRRRRIGGERHGGDQRSPVDVPHVDRHREPQRTPGELRRRPFGEHVDPTGAPAQRPRQRGSEPVLGIGVEKHPGVAGDLVARDQVRCEERGAARDLRGGGRSCTELIGDERVELGAQQRCALGARCRVQLFFEREP